MARKLKTYLTSIGFFELAIAAPSMKAALAAWGAGKNAFHHGFAEETQDAKIVTATMAKPGVVLKRAVGSTGAFAENAEPPKSLPAGKPKPKPTPPPKPHAKPAKSHKGPSAKVLNLAEARAAKQAAAAYEKEQVRREKEDEKREAADAAARVKRDAAVDKAEAVLDKARKRHETTMSKIADERDKLDAQEAEEMDRWSKEKKKLETGIRDAKD